MMRIAVLVNLAFGLLVVALNSQVSANELYKACIDTANFFGSDKEPCKMLLGDAPPKTQTSVQNSIPEEFWTESQSPSGGGLNFTRAGKQITAGQINKGDVLAGGRRLEIRSAPIGSAAVLFMLNKDVPIRVVEKKTTKLPSGAQRIWLRIANASTPATPEVMGTPQSAEHNTASEAAYQEKLAAAAAAQAAISEKVMSCFRAGTANKKFMTISDMRDCAGVWVSPRALVHCSIYASCPVLQDTVEGRSAFDTVLLQYGPSITRDSVLHLDVENLPPFPTAAAIEQCKKNDNAANQIQCASQSIENGKYNALVACFSKSDEVARLGCFAENVNNANFTVLMGCMSGGSPNADKLVDCTLNPKIKDDARKLRECVSAAKTPQSAAMCVSGTLPGPQQAFADCAASAGSNENAARCLDNLSPNIAKLRDATVCMADSSVNPVGCASNVLPGDAGIFAKCIGGEPNAKKWSDCAVSSNADFVRVNNLALCIKNGSSSAGCASKYIGGDGAAFAGCMATGSGKLGDCLAEANPTLGNAEKAFSCISKSTDVRQAFSCAAPHFGGDAAKIATCVANGDRVAAATCLLGDKPEARAVQRVYKCVSNGYSASDLIANCSEGLLDSKSSQTVACVARAGGDKAQLAGCAASAALPPDAARLVGCAASSQGATSFALCAAGPAMNEEWRIAAECAVQSGGNPVGFAGCTAGRLTLKELTQCFNGKGCFGPNNTIIKAYTTAFNDLTKGPGPNNDAVVFLNKVKDLAGGPNSVINNPAQLKGGPNSMINNPGQIWGGDSSVFNQVAGGKNSEVRKVLRAMDISTWKL